MSLTTHAPDAGTNDYAREPRNNGSKSNEICLGFLMFFFLLTWILSKADFSYGK